MPEKPSHEEPEKSTGNLEDVVDIKGIQEIMDDFFRLTQIGVAVVDLKGKVLISTGWQDICVKFHRVHPETRKRCIESDTILSSGVEAGDFKIYHCRNGMWDMATPIVVGGNHVGNLFLGQFFFDDEMVDYRFFKAQARRYGFDEKAYFKALDRVPRWSRETVNSVMTFYSRFANLISKLSYSNLKLARSLEERNRAIEERARLMSAMEQAAEAIVITDQDGKIQYVNPAFEQITGYSEQEVRGKNSRILKSGHQNEAFYRELWSTISNGKTWKSRMVNRRKDGTCYTEDVSISPVLDKGGWITNFVSVKRDVTSEIELEKRLLQAQKMEAIGNLAGGIAHDFNNILSPIMLHAEMAMMDLPADSRLQETMKQIYSSAERAKDLVRQILTFARAREEKKIPLRLSLILKEALKFLRATIPSTIEIRHVLKTGRDTVMADPTQIHQIVMNLCTNAAHAMKDTGGRLTVSLTEAREVPGDFLRISVRDTGKGIEPGILERIFDPYFTTKGPGQGTGLGLAVVHGIVESCGGRIDVESEEGKGTVFHVLLPVVDSDVSLNEDVGAESVGGTERILLVDDEEALLKILRRMLERLGYRVTAANNGSEALKLFRLAPSSFDLVITDQTMPGLRGSDLAGEIMAVRDDIPVILCTGFSDQIDEASAFEMGIRAFVSKPVVMHEMAARIREALEQKFQ